MERFQISRDTTSVQSHSFLQNVHLLASKSSNYYVNKYFTEQLKSKDVLTPHLVTELEYSQLTKTDTFGAGTRCPSQRGVRLREVSVLRRVKF